MHTFLSVFIIATVTLIANVSTVEQSESTVDIKPCAAALTTFEYSVITSNKAFNFLTVQNVEQYSEGVLKQNDKLITAIKEASQSCCYPPNTFVNEDQKNYLFAEASKFLKGVEVVTSDLARLHKKSITDGYRYSFSRFVFSLYQSATKLEFCLVERPPKDKMSEATAFNAQLKVALDKTSSLYPQMAGQF